MVDRADLGEAVAIVKWKKENDMIVRESDLRSAVRETLQKRMLFESTNVSDILPTGVSAEDCVTACVYLSRDLKLVDDREDVLRALKLCETDAVLREAKADALLQMLLKVYDAQRGRQFTSGSMDILADLYDALGNDAESVRPNYASPFLRLRGGDLPDPFYISNRSPSNNSNPFRITLLKPSLKKVFDVSRSLENTLLQAMEETGGSLLRRIFNWSASASYYVGHEENEEYRNIVAQNHQLCVEAAEYILSLLQQAHASDVHTLLDYYHAHQEFMKPADIDDEYKQHIIDIALSEDGPGGFQQAAALISSLR